MRVSPTVARYHKYNKWVSFSVQNMITAWHNRIIGETFVEQWCGAAQYSRTACKCGASASDKLHPAPRFHASGVFYFNKWAWPSWLIISKPTYIFATMKTAPRGSAGLPSAAPTQHCWLNITQLSVLKEPSNQARSSWTHTHTHTDSKYLNDKDKDYTGSEQ